MTETIQVGGSRPAKVTGVEVSEIADGLVIYQDKPERVHYLNHTAALVYELCTGEHTESDITRLVGHAFGLDAPPAAEVRACLAQLRGEGVVG
jgi:hypothetical protein